MKLFIHGNLKQLYSAFGVVAVYMVDDVAAYDLLKGIATLTVVSVIWDSSFPAIKLIMYEVNEYTYTWVRGLSPCLS